MTTADIWQIVIGIISILASVVLSLIIFFYQIKTEKRVKQQDIDNKVTNFIIENRDEINLLPLCIISNCLHKTDKHARRIYTNFNKLDKNVQQAILDHENINTPLINNKMMINNCITEFVNLCDKYKLGKNMLYEGAKYLHGSYDDCKNEKIENINPFVFINPAPKFMPEANMSLLHYIQRYLENVVNPNNDLIKSIRKQYFVPPMDVLYEEFNFGHCDKNILYFWIMRFVISSCYAFCNYELVRSIPDEIMPIMEEFNIETYEDMYYYAIYMLTKSFSSLKQLKF